MANPLVSIVFGVHCTRRRTECCGQGASRTATLLTRKNGDALDSQPDIGAIARSANATASLRSRSARADACCRSLPVDRSLRYGRRMRMRLGLGVVAGVVALSAVHGCTLSAPTPLAAAGTAGIVGGSAVGGGTDVGGSGQAERGGSSNASGGDAGAVEAGGEGGTDDAGSSGSSAGGMSGRGEATGGAGAMGGSAGSVSGAGTRGDTPCTSATDDWDNDGWTLADGDCDDCDDRRSPGNFDVAGECARHDCDGTSKPGGVRAGTPRHLGCVRLRACAGVV